MTKHVTVSDGHVLEWTLNISRVDGSLCLCAAYPGRNSRIIAVVHPDGTLGIQENRPIDGLRQDKDGRIVITEED